MVTQVINGKKKLKAPRIKAAKKAAKKKSGD
jgi:hypothetical protein